MFGVFFNVAVADLLLAIALSPSNLVVRGVDDKTTTGLFVTDSETCLGVFCTDPSEVRGIYSSWAHVRHVHF